jgi:pyruvate/2-oxoglutarate dehydrogenase complex dihydrolipoamide dehydrogenase (E3) component
MTQNFDAIVIGAGQAGPSLAGRLTAAGMKVALIERDKFGGTCVNTGCMPTKTLVASAYAARQMRRRLWRDAGSAGAHRYAQGQEPRRDGYRQLQQGS